jgi:hypothetical protein
VNPLRRPGKHNVLARNEMDRTRNADQRERPAAFDRRDDPRYRATADKKHEAFLSTFVSSFVQIRGNSLLTPR